MLIIFTRSIILYLFLLIIMRLMGKRQLGELQPFEFAITLIIAELACIPMSEISIPISYGLIPVITLFLMHLLITKLATKSIKFRAILNGKPVIVIDENGINAEMLKNSNMSINDLLDAMRSSGYFSFEEVAFAILETNGKLSIIPKASLKPLTPMDMNIQVPASSMLYSLVCEGKLMRENISLSGTDIESVERALKHHDLKVKDVLVMTLNGGEECYIQPYKGRFRRDNFVNISSVKEDSNE